jgi:hypothetical protein
MHYPAVGYTNAAVFSKKPGSPTAPELEVASEIEPKGFEPEAAQSLKSIFTKMKTQPEATVPKANGSGEGGKPGLARKDPPA